MLSYGIVVLLAGLSLGDAKWAYTEVATAEGQPCFTDCKDGKCIVDSSGTEKTCISSGVKSPIFSTTQLFNLTRPHCLSNCGTFGIPYEWCYTSEDQDWDFCNSSPHDRTFSMIKCDQPCTKGTAGYRCVVGFLMQHYCAPPAITNEPNVDTNKENLGIRNMDK